MRGCCRLTPSRKVQNAKRKSRRLRDVNGSHSRSGAGPRQGQALKVGEGRSDR